jgi:hypothetical protein
MNQLNNHQQQSIKHNKIVIENTKKKKKYYPEIEASSLAQSRHMSGLSGNTVFMASLACLSLSISPIFLNSFMY